MTNTAEKRTDNDLEAIGRGLYEIKINGELVGHIERKAFKNWVVSGADGRDLFYSVSLDEAMFNAKAWLDTHRARIKAGADNVKVGDTVRSFHFEGRDLEGERASYIIGIVEAVGENKIDGCDRYTIRVIADIFGGEVVTHPAGVVYPPVNGTEIWGEDRVTDCVVKA